MNVAKRMLSLAVAAALASALSFSQAPEASGGEELSKEEYYLQESMEAMVIREQARGETRESKFEALQIAREMLDSGSSNEEIHKTLEFLAFEGVVNKTREGGLGRVTNNYPDVRARAAEYLGEVGGEAAKDTLIKVMLVEPEPMVLTEAIKSLAKIGMDEGAETTSTISWIVSRFDVLNPDNLMALAALDAYEQLYAKNGTLDPSAIRTIRKIAEGTYVKKVQDRARATMTKLRKGAASAKKDGAPAPAGSAGK